MTTIDEIRLETEVPVVITDDQGFIIHINDCFTDAFLWKVYELIGEPITNIIPINFYDVHNLGFSRFLMTQNSKTLNHPFKAKVLAKDGSVILSEHLIIAVQIRGKWFFGGVLRPLES